MESKNQPVRGAAPYWERVIATLSKGWRQVTARLQRQLRSREFCVDGAMLLVLAVLCSFDVRGLESVLLGLAALGALCAEQHRRRRVRFLDPVDRLDQTAQTRRSQEKS